jgi:hypothetical protein
LNSLPTYCRIHLGEAFVNGELFYQHMGDESFLVGLYRQLGISYPKFFKMDEMAKLAFLGSEMVLVRAGLENYANDDVAFLFANQRSSLETDIQFYDTLKEGIPSPALFVYTLPNIGMGEVCIRHAQHGENNFLVMEKFVAKTLLQSALPLLEQGAAKAVLIAWTEVTKDGPDGFFVFISRKEELQSLTETLNELYATN